MSKVDWKKMGFNSEEEYNQYMKDKMGTFFDRIRSNPKLLDVFKRLKDK